VLHNPSPSTDQEFGCAVAISGTRLVVGVVSGKVGSENPGVAYVYDLAGTAPSIPVFKLENPQTTPEDGGFGYAVAISGTRVVVGATNNYVQKRLQAGSAYVYDLASAAPTVPMVTLDNPEVSDNELFGYTVAIDGSRVAVGTLRDQEENGDASLGRVYVYDLAGPTPAMPTVKIVDPPSINFGFGDFVSISGTQLVVGGNGAFVYDLGSATPSAIILALTEIDGGPVAISGGYLAVGTPYGSTGAQYAGSVNVYDLTGSTPAVPMLTLNNPHPTAGANFGWAIALSGTRLVAGTPNDDIAASNDGSALVYDLAGITPTIPLTAC
jgi:hypothetical protein